MLKLFEVKKGDIVSVIGSGGKSSLIHSMAKELQRKGRTLISTSTKIFFPPFIDYDIMYIGNEPSKYIIPTNEGIYIYGERITPELKISNSNISELEKYSNLFDFTLIESDGSKGRLLKGWNEREPVYLRNTSKTIGVINIKLLGKILTDEEIHRYSEFLEISSYQIGEKLKEKHISNIINHPRGLFKKALGKKILFINMVDNARDIERVLDFLYYFKLKDIDRIIYGSIMQNHFYLYSR